MKKIFAGLISLFVMGGSAIAAEEVPLVIPLENRGALNMLIPDNYEKKVVRERDNDSPTVELHSDDGFIIMITPLWDSKNNQVKTAAELKPLIEEEGKRFLKNAVEKKLEIKEISGKNAAGYYFFLTDRAPKKGEYKYCLRAYISVGDLLINASMFSNESKNSLAKTVAILSKLSQQSLDMSQEELFEKTGITIVDKEDKKITAVSNPIYHYFLVIPYKKGWEFAMGNDYILYGRNGKMQLSIQKIKNESADDMPYLEAIKSQYLKHDDYYKTESIDINDKFKQNVLEIVADAATEKSKNRKQYNYFFTKTEEESRFIVHFSTLIDNREKESINEGIEVIKMLTASFRGDFEKKSN